MKKAYYGDYSYMTRVDDSRSRRVARARQVRRQKMLVLIGILITVVLCLFFSIKAFANTDKCDEESDLCKQYKSVMIYCGDTIGSIAEDNYDIRYSSVGKMEKEIMSINHICADEKLIPGNFLIIPYYASHSSY